MTSEDVDYRKFDSYSDPEGYVITLDGQQICKLKLTMKSSGMLGAQKKARNKMRWWTQLLSDRETEVLQQARGEPAYQGSNQGYVAGYHQALATQKYYLAH